MSIKSIAHVAFKCADMEKSLHFYCDILGFTRAFEIKTDRSEPWIEYIKVCGGQFIELFYTKPGDILNNGNSSYNHLCLETDDIYKTCEAIESKGYPIDSEPVKGKDLNIQAWLKDPDGNRIELMQIDSNSPQATS